MGLDAARIILNENKRIHSILLFTAFANKQAKLVTKVIRCCGKFKPIKHSLLPVACVSSQTVTSQAHNATSMDAQIS